MSQTIDQGISVLAAGRSRVAAAFADAVESGRLELPLPGGRTRERWAALADLAGQDLSLARLAEGHADALAILAELGAAGPVLPPGIVAHFTSGQEVLLR